MAGGNDLARLVSHAQQRLMKGRGAAFGRNHRLEGETETFLAQAADDFGGAVGVELTLGIALLRLAVDDIAVGRQFARLGQGLFGAGDGGVGVGGVFRQDERADRQQGPDRPALRLDDAFARHAQETLGGDGQFVFPAIVENETEFRAGIARDGIAGTHHLPQPAAHVDDHFIGHFEAIGIVDD